MGLGEGWGVDVMPKKQASSSPASKQPARKAKASKVPRKLADAPTGESPKAAPRVRSPYMDINSEQGILGLTMLQQRLKRAEMGACRGGFRWPWRGGSGHQGG